MSRDDIQASSVAQSSTATQAKSSSWAAAQEAPVSVALARVCTQAASHAEVSATPQAAAAEQKSVQVVDAGSNDTALRC